MRKSKSSKTNSTRSKVSKLVDPPNGDINVDPQSEILIAFEVEGDNWETDAFAEVNGRSVVENGVAKNGWTTTRFYKQGHFGHMGLRKPGGMPREDIFVKAWCQDAFTVDQRFFVKGASAYKRRPENSVKIPNGWFSINGTWRIRGKKYDTPDYLSGGIPCRDLCAVYPQENTVGFLGEDGVEFRYVPDGVFENYNDLDMARLGDGYILVVIADQETRIVKPRFWRNVKDSAESVEITDRYINISHEEGTFHLPVDYEPTPLEDSFDSWYRMTCERDGDWDHRFGDDLFLWIGDEEMVAMNDPDPFFDTSDAVLWRRNDIRTELKNIDILDSEHVVVNDEVFLNVKNPSVYKI